MRVNEVDKVIAKFGPKTKPLAVKLRKLVKKTLPNATETVKWGKPLYLVKGKNAVWIIVYKKHVDLGFFAGSKIKSKLLEGTGKKARHVKIRTAADIAKNEKELKRLLKETAKIALRKSS